MRKFTQGILNQTKAPECSLEIKVCDMHFTMFILNRTYIPNPSPNSPTPFLPFPSILKCKQFYLPDTIQTTFPLHSYWFHRGALIILCITTTGAWLLLASSIFGEESIHNNPIGIIFLNSNWITYTSFLKNLFPWRKTSIILAKLKRLPLFFFFFLSPLLIQFSWWSPPNSFPLPSAPFAT